MITPIPREDDSTAGRLSEFWGVLIEPNWPKRSDAAIFAYGFVSAVDLIRHHPELVGQLLIWAKEENQPEVDELHRSALLTALTIAREEP